MICFNWKEAVWSLTKKTKQGNKKEKLKESLRLTVKIARRSNYNIDLRKKGKFKNCKTDAVIIRILTDVSAMLPSSGYTRINNVRSSLNLAHVIDGIIARVPNEIARYGARVTKRKKKGGDSRKTKVLVKASRAYSPIFEYQPHLLLFTVFLVG